MVKQINVYFDDNDYEKLLKIKGNRSWKDLILELINKKEIKNDKR